MPYCSQCGVEVDQQVVQCPLCDAPIQQLPMSGHSPWPRKEAPAPQAPPRSRAERMELAQTITTLGFLIPASIVMAVDWFVSAKLTWSLFPLVSLGGAWLWALLPLIFTRRPYLLITSVTSTAVALEWALGLLAGEASLILNALMPVTLAAGAFAALILLLARKARRLGGNLAGWILIALTILLVSTEILLNHQISGNWQPGWSLIAAAATLPVSILLLYLHARLSVQSRMRQYFHV